MKRIFFCTLAIALITMIHRANPDGTNAEDIVGEILSARFIALDLTSDTPPRKAADGHNRVLGLDGDGDEVNMGDASSLVMRDVLTVEAWIYPTGRGSGGSGGGGGIIVNKEGEYELARFASGTIQRTGSGEVQQFADGVIQFAVANGDPGWNWVSSGYIAPLKTWTHIAWTYAERAGVFRVFANGVPVFSTTGHGSIGDAYSGIDEFKIGARRPGAGQYFDGFLDEVRIWNIVRTEAEIRTTMNASLHGDEPGLVGYWNFDDGTATDLSPNDNDGTLIGDAAIIEADTSVSATAADQTEGVPIFYPGNGHYYELVPGEILWPAAKAAAETLTFGGVQGHLLTITSQAEQDFIDTAAGGIFVGHYAIGGFQLNDEDEPAGNWFWVTGEPINKPGTPFENWGVSEPNNSNGVGAPEEFLQLRPEDGGWNDYKGDVFSAPGYIVEFDPPGPISGINRVLSLDGDGDYIDVPDSPSLHVIDSITMEAQIYFRRIDSLTPYILYKHSGYGFAPSHSGGLYWFFYRDFFTFVDRHLSPPVPLKSRKWYHIAVTLEAGGTVKTYLNGDLVDEWKIDVPIHSAGVLRIGMSPPTSDEFFNGFLDEIRIWNTARTQAEIQTTMNTTLAGNEPGLVGYWNFDDGTANDLSPNGNYGTLKGDAKIIDGKPSVSAWTFSPVAAISPGEEFSVDLTVENITDLAGWESDIRFDPAALEVIQIQEGEFLKQQETRLTFWQPGVIDNAIGEVTGVKAALLGAGGVTGIGTVLTITFKAKQIGESIVELQDLRVGDSAGQPIPYETIGVTVIVTAFLPWDINQDRLIDIFDLILVAQSFDLEEPSNPRADVNKDGSVNIFDLILVAQHFGESTTSGAPVAFQKPNTTQETMIRRWLATARQANDGSIAFRRGIAVLERLLSVVTPKQTAIFHNYPNPFNPETWIPYQLATDADVQVRIYDISGTLIRQLGIGHQRAGYYVNRERAAYLDGRDEHGEQVSSGLYFYHLRAGDYSAVKRMVILK